MAKPGKKEYPAFYQTYIDALDDQGNVLSQMETSLKVFEKELSELELDKQEYRWIVDITKERCLLDRLN